MEKNKIEELRGRVHCAAVLERSGFAVDLKESTRRAIKFRRDDDIIIVIHDGKGWFDPLSEAKGDIFSLVEHLDGVGFTDSVDRVRELVGAVLAEPIWTRPARSRSVDLSVAERWVADANHGRAPSHGAISGNGGNCPRPSSALRSDVIGCAKVLMAACGLLTEIIPALSRAGKNAALNGEVLPPVGRSSSFISVGTKRCGSALPKRRSMR
jgi:hypothetical protein